MNRDEAQAWFVQLLLDKVRQDQYPSVTQLKMIEDSLPLGMVEEYLDVLIEKAEADTWPSVTLLSRIQRVAKSLPTRAQEQALQELEEQAQG